MTSGPDGIRARPPHQVFGLKWARDTFRFIGVQVLPFCHQLNFIHASLLIGYSLLPC